MAKVSASPLALIAAAIATTDYLVTSALHHDGQRYEPGATIALSDAQAKPLLGVAIAAPVVAEEVSPLGGEGEGKDDGGGDNPPA